ncbi:MAG: ELWxxDGT repeat protein, partial [Pirellulaceae bacterium]
TTTCHSPENLVNVSGTVFFYGSNTSTFDGRELCKSNGTNAGTVMVKDINPGTADSGISQLTNVGGVLYFRANNGTAGVELWKSDGTDAGTVLARDIRLGAGNSSNPKELKNIGGTLYFSANDGTHGYELWKSDGAGTSLVTDISVGSIGSNPRYLTKMGSLVYFRANDADLRTNLWKSDGTAAGTVLVKDIPGPTELLPAGLTVFDSTLFFSGFDPIAGQE